MTWHDCKTDPPKESKHYILTIKNYSGVIWVKAFYDAKWELWVDEFDEGYFDEEYEEPIKWAEVDLSEVK